MINLDGLNNFDDLNSLNQELQKRVDSYNQSSREDFDGLSPQQMYGLQHDFLQGKSFLVMNKLLESQLEKCPLLVQVRFLIDKMKGGRGIKLTKTGALSTKLVKEIYELGCLKNEGIEKGYIKLYKEGDSEEISITRILLEISILVKKRNGKLYLTKNGEKHAEDGNFILEEILRVLFFKFNWAYYDGFNSAEIGRVNPVFSLFLLKKYGDRKRSSLFYAEKYFRAFPMLMEEGEQSYRCYSLRTFERYFRFMGFVKVEKKKVLEPVHLEKTEFFDQLFSLKF